MIGKLKGRVEETGEQHVLLDVGGVCYIAFCSASTLRTLPEQGQAASLLIETHVREDHIHLYGFASAEERAWFRLLLTVKGVGTKVALAILSVLTPAQLAVAIASQDKAAFKPCNGVGTKLAERIVIELKDKDMIVTTSPGVVAMPSHSGTLPAASHVQDAVSALTNLGYNRSDAFRVATTLAGKNESASVEQLIRDSLKELAT